MATVTVSDGQTPPAEAKPPASVPQNYTVTIIAQDPFVRRGKDGEGPIVTARVPIPAEHLDPGPCGARFQVIDYDAEQGTLLEPAEFKLADGDPFPEPTDEQLTGDPRFRALNVYAIAARTLATFESALGRRLEWASADHQINLVPRALAELNAFYSPEDGAILFGYENTSEGQIQTALSHDIIAHETTHAVLDGLRPRYNEPGLPDQSAFHEALGDIVAMLSVFSIQEVVEELLGEPNEDGTLSPEAVELENLRISALFGLAEQLGRSGERGRALRRSLDLSPSRDHLAEAEFKEPHRRGEIVVAAVTQALLSIWRERLEAFTGTDGDKPKHGPSRRRVAEEGSTAAGQLLRMVIRGIDYMPPVELEFEDVIEGILKADEVVAPDDQRGYRETLAGMFSVFGIDRPDDGIVDVSTKPLVYERLNYTSLRASPDEVFRFLWDNADTDLLGIDRRWHTVVRSVRPSVRIGPDGLIVNEVVAEYTQTVNVTVADLPFLPEGFTFTAPEGLPADTRLQLWGGGVLVFDQFGRAKYHVRKPLGDGDRQRRRLEYLVETGRSDDEGRFGFTLSQSPGERFAALHVDDQFAAERW